MTDKTVAFVADGQIPAAPPPANAVGPVKWMKDNLFSGVVNSILTIVSIAFIIFVAYEVIPWFLNSSWNPADMSLKGCRAEATGACFAVLVERFWQFIFGFYPADLYWRPTLAFVLMLVAIWPVLFSSAPRPLLILTAVYPMVGYWLIWGGSVWGPLAAALTPVVAWAAWKGLSRVAPQIVGKDFAPLTALIGGAIAAIFWVFIAITWIDGQITGAIAEGRYADRLVELEKTVAANESEEAVRNAERLTGLINGLPEDRARLAEVSEKAEAARDALPGAVDVSRVELADEEATPQEVAQLEEALKLEGEVISIESRISQVEKEVGLVGLRSVESAQLGGFLLSMIIGVVGIVASLPLGVALALGRQSKLMIVKSICVGFIEAMRGVPLITLLFVASTLLNYFLPPGTSFDIILRVCIMVTFFSAAYMAEVIRGGIAALPKGQYEAADAMGLTYWQSMQLIILPQALKISIPNIVSTFIGLFKDTVLVSQISLFDPIGLLNPIRADAAWNGIIWELYGFVALFFFIFCFGMSRYSMYLERKLATDHR